MLACFNALSLKGAGGAHQIETRIQWAAYLSAFIRHLKNQYCDLEAQKLDGPGRGAAPNNLLQKHLCRGQTSP